MRVNNTIVLENDAVLYMLEKPLNSRRDGWIAAYIVFKESRLNVASPGNSCCFLSCPLAFLFVLRKIEAGTVSRYKEPLRLDLPQILHDRSSLIRSIEDSQKDRDLFNRDAAI
jgi:hypothetical protein